jgi:hypothetical protein
MKVAEECWFSISDSRKRKSLEIFPERYGRAPRLKVEMRNRISDIELRNLTEEGGEPSSFLETLYDPARSKSEIFRLVACTALADKAT